MGTKLTAPHGAFRFKRTTGRQEGTFTGKPLVADTLRHTAESHAKNELDAARGPLAGLTVLQANLPRSEGVCEAVHARGLNHLPDETAASQDLVAGITAVEERIRSSHGARERLSTLALSYRDLKRPADQRSVPACHRFVTWPDSAISNVFSSLPNTPR
jgi:hypothetical protein